MIFWLMLVMATCMAALGIVFWEDWKRRRDMRRAYDDRKRGDED